MEHKCTRCGLEREHWTGLAGQGYLRDGEAYCCGGCATEAGCACSPDAATGAVEKQAGASEDAMRRDSWLRPWQARSDAAGPTDRELRIDDVMLELAEILRLRDDRKARRQQGPGKNRLR